MQDKVLKMALIGVGNMGKKYAQMIVSGEVLHMKLAAVVIRRDEQIAWGKTLVNVDGQPVEIFRSADELFHAAKSDFPDTPPGQSNANFPVHCTGRYRFAGIQSIRSKRALQ